MAKDYIKIATGILDSVSYGTLATVSEAGTPWNCPVIMVHDEALNFYWFSDRESQHGRNVRRNPSVFIVIYDSTVPKHGLDYGVYIQAHAREVPEMEQIEHARRLLWGPGKEGSEKYSGSSPRRVYHATPKHIWVNDIERDEDGKFVRDYRVELGLGDLRRHPGHPQ